MYTHSFSFSDLREWNAVEQIVAQENLDFGRAYHFAVYCADGFREVMLIVDKDGVWSYTSKQLEDNPVLVGITTYRSDGTLSYHEEVMPYDKYEALPDEDDDISYETLAETGFFNRDNDTTYTTYKGLVFSLKQD